MSLTTHRKVVRFFGTVCALAATAARATPVLFDPVLAVVDQPTAPRVVALSLSGTGFRAPLAGSSRVVIENPSLPTLTFPWPSPQLLAWRDTQIVLSVPPAYRNARVRVVESSGASSATVNVEYYDYQAFPTGTRADDSPPLALAADAGGKIWINAEFHRELKRLDPATGTITGYPIPYPAPPTALFGGGNISPLGEDILIDEQGGVWLTEGGNEPGCSKVDHSRVLRLNPTTGVFTIFNVPGDRNGVAGLAYDRSNHRLWYTLGKREGCVDASGNPRPCVPFLEKPRIFRHAGVGSFDTHATSLACAPHDPYFGFPAAVCGGAPIHTCANAPSVECLSDDDCALANRLCAADANPCFTELSVDPVGAAATELWPAHIALGSDAALWVTNFWGTSSLARLDPASPSTVQRFPLPAPNGALGCAQVLLQAGPWEIETDPDGGLVFSEGFNNAIGRFDVGRQTVADCEHLDASGQNPCVTIANAPGDPAHALYDFAIDAARNVWFSQSGPSDDAADTGSVGYLKGGDWVAKQMLLLPPLSIFGRTEPTRAFSGFGGSEIIVVPNPDRTETIWVGSFARRELVRLRRI
jgi:streptogramin lyase